MLADVDDVEARLGRLLTDDEAARAEGLIEEASILVESHVGKAFEEPIPGAVRVVVSRMVARVLQAPTDSYGVESTSYSAGPFSQNRTYSQGASGGSPWLTAVDKKVLARFGRRRGGIFSVELG